jgi:sulfite reductase (NADPH) flavoprotein alpha-component
MAPHAVQQEQTSQRSLSELNGSAAHIVAKSNPFGTSVDPHSIKGTVYTSGATVINQAIYSISSKIFSYEAVSEPNILDAHIKVWSQDFSRENSFGVVPFYHSLKIASGASNAILGYFSKNGTNGQPVASLLGANGLAYMRPTLAGAKSDNLPLALNVSALDYDITSGSLVANYNSPISVARSLGYSVVTPVSNDGLEAQHLTVLNHYLAALTGRPSINLFDGPEYLKTHSKLSGLLSVAELGALYQDLLSRSTAAPSSVDEAINVAFSTLNQVAGTNYQQFEYVGAPDAKTVFITYGTHISSQFNSIVENSSYGLLKIRVPLPFNQGKFAASLPASTKKVVVLNQAGESTIKADLTLALFLNGRNNINVEDFSYPLDFTWTPITIAKVFEEVLQVNPESVLPKHHVVKPEEITANTSPSGRYLLWGKDRGILVETADKLALSLSLDHSKNVCVRNKYDNATGGGLFQSQITSGDSTFVSVDTADVVLIEDPSLLEYYDVLATVKPGATVLLGNSKPIKTSVEEDVIAKLPESFKKGLALNQNKLTIIDLTVVEELEKLNDSTKGFTAEFLVQLGFWRAALPELKGFIVNKLLQANGNKFELLAAVLDKFINLADEAKALKPVEISSEWAQLKVEGEKPEEGEKSEEGEQKDEKSETEEPVELPFFPSESAFSSNPSTSIDDEQHFNQSGYKQLAQHLTFPEAFNVKQELRPDLPVKNFVVKVQENKRLTPTEYSRNIFHIEFDITGTGLTYDIGEALGIHGRNNADAVEDFLKFYNVNGDDLVEVSSKDDSTVHEVRSARQTLTENVDFLGKPPKRFYEALAEFATDEEQKKHLEKLASSEGAEELKKRQDVDFDSYVDILEEFTSARPSFVDLVKIITPLKRREYSIASSQKIHENSVHLLIVVVDWVDPKGRLRYGHCSKYLSDLKVGSELVVSVKPSVMKLPPLSTQPIVMSGLGTGLAPFKAFLEEKIWQKQQGMEIGEIYLYLGSRHKKEEYLYGELWEAYKDAGVLTHIGAAFSRDQPEKIYIQDKIRETIEPLTDAIVAKNGSFYLCGPTWPVPDITGCLEDIVKNAAAKEGKTVKDVAKVVEDMKEEGRYILEVY